MNNEASPPGFGSEPRSLAAMHIGGTEVHYFVLCPRKLWWFAHRIEQEHVTGGMGAENVALGQLLHQESYADKGHKDVLIDGLLRLDFTENGVVHEIKKSQGGHQATLFQLLYYLYYLKHEKGIETTGLIDYPQQKRKESVELTPEREEQVAQIIQGIVDVRALPVPPFVPAPMPICKKCSYQDLCWG